MHGILFRFIYIGHLTLPTNWAVTKMQYFVIRVCLRRTFVLNWICKLYLKYLSLFIEVRYFKVLDVHETDIWPFQGLLTLTNIIHPFDVKSVWGKIVSTDTLDQADASRGPEGVRLIRITGLFRWNRNTRKSRFTAKLHCGAEQCHIRSLLVGILPIPQTDNFLVLSPILHRVASYTDQYQTVLSMKYCTLRSAIV